MHIICPKKSCEMWDNTKTNADKKLGNTFHFSSSRDDTDAAM